MRTFLTLTFVLILAVSFVNAAAPSSMNYQGRLTDPGGAPVADGSYPVVFTIYDAAVVGSSKWTETQNVNTVDGLFSVLLGTINPILDTVFNESTRYLGIAVDGDPELTPRTTLVSVPYSQRVSTVDGASGGNITSKVAIGPGHTNTGAYGFVAGQNSSATGTHSTVSGGQNNNASGSWSVVGGGGDNRAGHDYATVGGGTNNAITGPYSTISGGIQNSVSGMYSSILGGFADTITSNHSYLFGINANLSQDSTFRVDMPHIRFGSAASSYEFPTYDGEAGQVMATDGGGQVDWTDPGGGGGGANGWVDDGSVVRLDNSSDSVGIGTTTPDAPVHITKTSNSSTPVFGTHIQFSNEGTGGGVAAYVDYDHGSNSGFSSGMLVSSSANSSDTAYGIATTTSNEGPGPAKGGLFEVAGNGAGHKYGIEARADNSANSETRGVYGIAGNSSAGPATGGYFETMLGGTGPKTGVAASAGDNSSALATGVDATAYNSGSGGSLAASLQSAGGSGVNKGVNLTVGSSGSSDALGYVSYIASDAGTAYGTSFDVYSATGAAIGIDVSATTDGLGEARGINVFTSRNDFERTYGIRSTSENQGSGEVYSGYFEATSDGTGAKNGVYGSAVGNQSSPVTGIAGGSSNTGSGYSYGVTASAYTSSGIAYGTSASATSNSGHAYGVSGEAKNYGNGVSYGGNFTVSNEGTGMKVGVYALANGNQSNPVYGSYFSALNAGSGRTYGVFCYANSGGTGNHYGVYGSEAAGDSGAAVYAAGDFYASGSKSAIVRTSVGEKLMYAVEATEVWFEDIGRAQLNNGHAHIELDPIFLETVEVSANNPLQVFVQLNGDCKGTYVTTGTTGFDVNELQGGTASVSFTYRVMAIRKGYVGERMRSTDAGKYDLNLYPERKAEIEAYWKGQDNQASSDDKL